MPDRKGTSYEVAGPQVCSRCLSGSGEWPGGEETHLLHDLFNSHPE